MSNASYEAWLTDPFGNNAVLLPFFVIDYARTVNEIGTLKLVIPRVLRPMDIDRDYRIYIYRSLVPGFGYLEMDTYWLVRKVTFVTTEDGDRTIEIECVSVNEILHTRIVAYNANTSYTLKTDQADDMILAVFRENLGALSVNTARDLSTYITVGTDISKGPVVTLDFARSYVDDVMSDISAASFVAGTPLYYDIVPFGTMLMFRVFTSCRGVDHRSGGNRVAVIMSDQNNMIGARSIVFDYSNEITYSYVGGPGEEGQRLIGTYEDTVRSTISPFSRRELWVDESSGTTSGGQAALDNKAKAATWQNRFKVFVQASILPSNEIVYGRDWAWGDFVTVDVDGFVLDCRINTVHVTVQENMTETIEAYVRNDT